MSFILDALKKSETERQRQAGPALFEVRVAPPRHRVAPWAIAIAALLAINLGVVGWIIARDRAAPAGAGAHAPRSSSTPAKHAPMPSLEHGGTPSAAAPAGRAGSAPLARTGPGPRSDSASEPAAGAGGASAAASGAAASDASTAGGVDANPADYAPAVAPAEGTPVPDGGGSVVRETESGLPTYQQAAAAPGANLPALRLDLDVYAARPADRFVFLNMVKLHEGQSLPDGVQVEEIRPDGAILSYQGERFVLHPHQ